jgi:hypothetical protein
VSNIRKDNVVGVSTPLDLRTEEKTSGDAGQGISGPSKSVGGKGERAHAHKNRGRGKTETDVGKEKLLAQSQDGEKLEQAEDIGLPKDPFAFADVLLEEAEDVQKSDDTVGKKKDGALGLKPPPAKKTVGNKKAKLPDLPFNPPQLPPLQPSLADFTSNQVTLMRRNNAWMVGELQRLAEYVLEPWKGYNPEVNAAVERKPGGTPRHASEESPPASFRGGEVSRQPAESEG